VQLIDPALAERFAADLAALWPEGERTRPLGLAVSGGADSLALLLLAHAALPPGGIAVASIDHGLRPEAAGEVALVEQVCAARGIAFTPLAISVPPGNLQAQARAARYAALGAWAQERGLGALATAHHADDQAETLLLRLNRGSGLAGLAAVRAASLLEESDMLLLRPLLGWRKAALQAVVAQAGITPAEDPSNANLAFDRVAMRARLAEADWLDVGALATSAAHLAEAWRAIEWYAGLDWDDMVHPDESRKYGTPGLVYYANVPRVIAIETISRIIRELGGHCTRAEAGRAFDRLWHGEQASLGGVLAVPGIERMKGIGVELRCWRFAPEPPRRVH
jgi:tRNA(Ile)-lysidine synthase